MLLLDMLALLNIKTENKIENRIILFDIHTIKINNIHIFLQKENKLTTSKSCSFYIQHKIHKNEIMTKIRKFHIANMFTIKTSYEDFNCDCICLKMKNKLNLS